MRILLIIEVLFLMGTGQNCSVPNHHIKQTQKDMATNITGFWQKVFADDCGQEYPNTLEFNEKGLFFTHKTENDPYTVWDVGTYSIESDAKISLSTSNDAVISYRYAVSGDHITFEVNPDCKITYKKQKQI